MEHVRWLAQPQLQRPTVVAAFTGWNDAGDAASSAVRHLVEQWGAKALAEIDPEEFTDFATVRPHVRLNNGITRTIVWPTVGIWSASTPGGDVILVLGPEPALRWRLFTEQIVAVAKHFDAGMVLTVGALLADVAHSKPVQVMGTATDQELIDRFDLQRSRYEGPTGIVGVLHDACQRAGIASASLWAAVPAYASQLPSPKAALALVTRACSMIGTPTPIGRLGGEATDYETRVTTMVSDDDDLIGYVARLETMGYDDLDDEGDRFDGQGGYLDEDDDEDEDDESFATLGEDDLDSDELMAEVEQFLREQPEQ
jgi:proteasome assembly chaperone (PAC2) family protein